MDPVNRTEMGPLKVRFGKRSLLFVAPALIGLAWIWSLALPPLSSSEAFDEFVAARQDSVRCRLCSMPYETAILSTIVPLTLVTLGMAAASVVTFVRVFGPPTLEINASGASIYRVPWRTRRFNIASGTRITVGPVFRFDPPIETDDGRTLQTINLRTHVTNLGADRIRARLKAMRSDWRIEN